MTTLEKFMVLVRGIMLLFTPKYTNIPIDLISTPLLVYAYIAIYQTGRPYIWAYVMLVMIFHFPLRWVVNLLIRSFLTLIPKKRSGN